MERKMHNPSKLALVEKLRAVVGDAGIITEEQAQASYTRDWLGKWQGSTPAVVRPATTSELAAVLQVCNLTHTPVITQGGNTGMSGGATPDASGEQVILSTVRMNRIREIDPVNNTITVDAGVLLASVQDAARDAKRFFPLSLGAEGSCTVGGNLATNAGGVAVLRYGNMRDLVLGLEVVLPDGRIWHGLKGLRKDNTGYDLRNLFVGSEGTLGVITGAVLKLFSQPQSRVTAWVGAHDLKSLIDLLSRLRDRAGERLVAFEMMSSASLTLVLKHVAQTRLPTSSQHHFYALIELADTLDSGLSAIFEQVLGDALADGSLAEAVLSSNEAHRSSFWKLREGISQAQVREGTAIKHDIALPISALASFEKEAEVAVRATLSGGIAAVQIVNFGHLGDGNLHYNVLLPSGLPSEQIKLATSRLNRVVHDLVANHNGSISAEHGIGQLRRDELRKYKSSLEIDLMMRIRRAFDPNQLMNPGILL
jgi:FAD/FMN-containing dehydrogenase